MLAETRSFGVRVFLLFPFYVVNFFNFTVEICLIGSKKLAYTRNEQGEKEKQKAGQGKNRFEFKCRITA